MFMGTVIGHWFRLQVANAVLKSNRIRLNGLIEGNKVIMKTLRSATPEQREKLNVLFDRNLQRIIDITDRFPELRDQI